MLANLHGNPGKRARKSAEPRPVGDLTADEPPDWLTDAQKEIWNYALRHAPRGLLGGIDRPLVTAWVIACDVHRQASVELSRTTLLVKAGPNTTAQVQSPFLAIVNTQARLMLRLASELGFTPVSRSRVVTEPSQSSDSDMTLDEFLASRPPRPSFN